MVDGNIYINTFSHCETLKIILHIRGTATYENGDKTKRQLLAQGDYYRYYQMSDRNSRHISRDVWNFWRYVQIFIYLFIPRFLAEPLKTFCGILEPRLGNAVIGSYN